MNLFVDVLAGGVSGGTSIMYAALGETVSERSGVINLGTEGCMLMGAFAGFAVTAVTGNPWMGVAAAAAAGGALALVHAILVVTRKANQFASGLSVLFLALGITALFGSEYVGRSITALQVVPIPGLSSIPFFGPILFEQNLLVYASYVIAPALWYVIFRSRLGLLLRTAGENAEVLTVNGYSIARVRYIAVVVGGMFGGVREHDHRTRIHRGCAGRLRCLESVEGHGRRVSVRSLARTEPRSSSARIRDQPIRARHAPLRAHAAASRLPGQASTGVDTA
jgi:ABC-type uncharacterized transport system permease subunit